LTLCFYPHQRCRAAPPAAAAVRVGVVLALPTDVVSGTRPRPRGSSVHHVPRLPWHRPPQGQAVPFV